jgi:hypothetical protein
VIENPARPQREDVLDPATFGRPVADMVIRRYASPDELLDDTYDKPLADLRGQMATLTRADSGIHTLYMHNGDTLDEWWNGCRAGGLAGATFRPAYYPPDWAPQRDGFLTFAEHMVTTWGPILTYPGRPGEIPAGVGLAGARIVIPGLYQVEYAGALWRMAGGSSPQTVKAVALAGPNPDFTGLYRQVGDGSNGTPDSPDYSWSYRSTVSCVAALQRDEWVGIGFRWEPALPRVQPAPFSNSAQIGFANGLFSLDLLAPF